MKSMCMYSLALMVALTGSFIGCGGSKDAQPTAQTKSVKTPAQQVSTVTASSSAATSAVNSSDFRLIGVWLGTSGFDKQAVEAKAATLDPESAAALLVTAATFDSMFIAAQYNPDGTLELDMTIQPVGGDVLSDQAFGTWQATKAGENALEVTTVEQHGDQTETSVKRYTIIDEDHFTIVPRVSEDLSEMSPIVLFERVLDEQIPLSAEATSDQDLR